MNTNLALSYEAYFSHPPLIHPTIHFRPNAAFPTNNDTSLDLSRCSLHTIVYMNDRLFIDPYELEDQWGPGTSDEHLLWDMQGKGKEGTKRVRWKLDPQVPDLERPVRYQCNRRIAPPAHISNPGSSSTSDRSSPQNTLKPSEYPYEAVLHVAQLPKPSIRHTNVSFDLDIPTHMRYQEPSTSGDGYRKVSLRDIQSGITEIEAEIELDVGLDVFWACERHTSNDNRLPHPPGLAKGHIITHLRLIPSSPDRPHNIALPAGIASHVGIVPPLTFVAVLFSWIYISRAMFRLWKRSRAVV